MTHEERFGTWYPLFEKFTQHESFIKCGKFVGLQRAKGYVYPSTENVFRCFRETPYNKIIGIIWGMDPYNKGEADGLAFSTSDSIPTPYSLRKIHKAIENDIYNGLCLEQTNDLSYLAHQGILLYNSSLTVSHNNPGSHESYWNRFSKEMVKIVNKIEYPIFVISMGGRAREFTQEIDHQKHFVIQVDHPAKASYTNGIWNHEECFKKADTFVKKQHNINIKW